MNPPDISGMLPSEAKKAYEDVYQQFRLDKLKVR